MTVPLKLYWFLKVMVRIEMKEECSEWKDAAGYDDEKHGKLRRM
jgi:hypothetical protein